MPDRKVTRNTFTGGQAKDMLPYLREQSTYHYALNAVKSDSKHKGYGLVNEGSDKDCNVGAGVVGWHYLEERNASILLKSGDNFWLFDHETNTERFIWSGSEFGCNFGLGQCEWHDIDSTTKNSCNDTFIYFSSKCEYYWFNLDEMLDSARKAGLKKNLECTGCASGCDFFRNFKKGCSPKINALAFKSGGGSLAAGAYHFVARFLNIDGGYSNWFNISDPVYVESEHNIAGEKGNGRIEVNISCLSCQFVKMQLAVIERIGGVYNPKILTNVNYNSSQVSYTYTGNEGTPITLQELLLKGNTYLQGKYLKVRDNMMWYYGIKQRKNLNWQHKVNEIQVEWVVWQVPVAYAKKYNIKSYMRGETYAFGIGYNNIDNTSSVVYHISACNGGGGASDVEDTTTAEFAETATRSNATNVGTNDTRNTGAGGDFTTGSISVEEEREVVRDRNHKKDTPHQPEQDEYDDLAEQIVDQWVTKVQDICGCDICTTGDCTGDMTRSEDLAGAWSGLFLDYGIDHAKQTTAPPTTLKAAAAAIMDAIQKRERKIGKARKYNITKSVGSYPTGDTSTEDGSVVAAYSISSGLVSEMTNASGGGTNFGDNYHDCEGNEESEVKFVEIDSGRTEPKEEKNIEYPCTPDCNGNPIYGSLAGSPVCHHKFPDTSDQPHYLSKSFGVPSELTPDADESNDGYVNILGVRFLNIPLPPIEETSVPLCGTNPYTIYQAKSTERNRTILLKGAAFGTYEGDNAGKTYQVPRNGANASDSVNRYLDTGGTYPRLVPGGGSGGHSHVVHSLDGLVRKPALNASILRHELSLEGEGYRHGLYAKGKKPDDMVKGKRVDQRGTRQAVNLNRYTSVGAEYDINFKTYAQADRVVEPPQGGSQPLLNKFQQETIWVGSGLPQKTDKSFVGDVLDHRAPITDAKGDYVTFKREMDDQYGDLVNLVYMPILQAGKSHNQDVSSIQGACGDVYIGPYSFVKTSYVSDRVGYCKDDALRFNIPAMEPHKKEKRCICDGPEDVIKQHNGMWVWPELPEDGDASDPKNWSGLHTIEGSRSKHWSEANGAVAITDYYYPRTLTTLVTVWGESRVNPWLRQKGKALQDQWYPEINNKYTLDSGSDIDNDTYWEDSYLNQFYAEVQQASVWQKVFKATIRIGLNIIFPMMGIDNLLDIESMADVPANLAEFPILFALWYLMTQVLLTNDFLDKILGIPVCKSDDIGGEGDGNVKGFFKNPEGYNWDYSAVNDIDVRAGMPDPYYTCDCDSCLEDQYTNMIYFSDRQKTNSTYDAFRHVRPLNFVNIPAHEGKLTNLVTIGGTFYAHTTDTMMALRYARTALSSTTGQVILGNSGLIQDPQAMTQGIVEGFAGLQHHNAAISTSVGYFFVDSDADKIYRYYNGSLQEISKFANFNFFKEHLGFCNKTSCVDQKVSGSNYYSLGIDLRHNRFLITKSDGGASFTYSFDLDESKWVSFHSYVPQAYIWDRKSLYSLEGSIYKHNRADSFLTFRGNYRPFIIEFTAVPTAGTQGAFRSFTFNHVQIRTEANQVIVPNCSYIEDLDWTFNKIAVWNSTQGTGTLAIDHIRDNFGSNENIYDLIVDKAQVVRAHKRGKEWNINGIMDHRKQDCQNVPMLICKTCDPTTQINEKVFDCSPPNVKNYRGKVFRDDHITYRLILDDGVTNKQLRLIYVDTFGPEVDNIG